MRPQRQYRGPGVSPARRWAPSFVLIWVCLGVTGVVSQHALGDSAGDSWEHFEIRLPKPNSNRKPPIVTALAIRDGGNEVAIAGDDHVVRLWDISAARFAAELTGHTDLVRTLAYSTNGSLLASAGNDGKLFIWDAADHLLLSNHDQPLPITRLVFARQGSLVTTVGFRSPLRFFDVHQGQEVRSLSCPCSDMRALAVSPDDRYLAAGGRNGTIRVWELATGSTVSEFTAHRQRIHAVQFSPDNEWIASCSDDRTVRVSRVDGSEPVVLRGPAAKVMSLVFCGTREIAAGGSDNMIRIWNVEQGAESARLAGHTGSIMALAYSSGTLVSAGYDTAVCVWRRTRNVAGENRAAQRVGARTSGVELR